jgi:general secretion pathway protein H
LKVQRGFTLVELLVVFAVIALLTTVVPPAFDRMRESAQYRDVVRTILSDIRQARHRAIAEGREVRFNVDLRQRMYGLEDRSLKPMPESLRMRATVAHIEISASQVASIRFLPSGGATGGSIDVLRPSGAGVRLTVDWLSGGVAQLPLVQ